MKLKLISIPMLLFLLQPTIQAGEKMSDSLAPGDAAPGFELLDQAGASRRLQDYRGRWLVLYFYPKDDTPGCTREACEFRDDHIKFDKVGAEVVGVSIDNTDSHAAFAKKYSLPFPLLADTGGKISDQYGSFFSLGPIKYAKRHTFIIDPEGRIAKIYRSVKPATHSDDVLLALKELQKNQKR